MLQTGCPCKPLDPVYVLSQTVLSLETILHHYSQNSKQQHINVLVFFFAYLAALCIYLFAQPIFCHARHVQHMFTNFMSVHESLVFLQHFTTQCEADIKKYFYSWGELPNDDILRHRKCFPTKEIEPPQKEKISRLNIYQSLH